jgi:putative methionine-R-sulfoxide reductase with GAF domain
MTDTTVDRRRALPGEIVSWADRLIDALLADHLHQHCSIFLFDPERDGLVLTAQVWGAGMDDGKVIPGMWLVPMHGSVCGRVYRTGQPALVVDTSLDPDYRDYPGGRMRSELAVPIQAGSRIVGVLNLESPWPATFGIDDLDRVSERAALAGAEFVQLGLARHIAPG